MALGCSAAWALAPAPGRSLTGIASLAGRVSNVSAICTWCSTITAFCCCPGCTAPIWPPAYWGYVGLTKGRGKLEKHHQTILPQKAIFLYPLRPDFKEILAR